MSTRSVVPFGPHHPVLPEPIHLDLVLEDEKVVDVIPSIGFIHRGLEKLVEKRDFRDFVYVAERMCGICSFMHGMSYCEAVEHIMGVELPPRAKYLRTIWCELSRLHSHLLWLGLLADAFGFESLFMQCWRLREKILDMFEASTGGRLIFSVNKIGGQRRDMDNAMLHGFVEKLGGLEEDLKGITSTFLANSAVNSRLKGVGYMTKKMAQEYGVAGPFMRASGIARDTRKLGYDAYGDLNFEPITSTEGDCYARTQVR
ncbi:MAG TPA: NADH-quinone oxidoreductase subunit D, partial [Ruminococcaceae bacterium]|nr:NADH-quinone oxidoreductase subunit D [Oscillospiraceae bacterium]HCB92095.1 NADH-quinone oxidoreductase subunit D [Oscillospiraceae bacterium]